jgi:hypothetical protein
MGCHDCFELSSLAGRYYHAVLENTFIKKDLHIMKSTVEPRRNNKRFWSALG